MEMNLVSTSLRPPPTQPIAPKKAKGVEMLIEFKSFESESLT